MTKKNVWKTFLPIFIVSIIAKGFSLLSKITLTATLGLKSMTLFGLINPLIVLIITLASFSLPNVLSCLIASHPEKGRKYVLTSFFFVFFHAIFLSFLLVTCADFIAEVFFKNPDASYAIASLSFLIPIVSISSLIKGYFLGSREVVLTTSSQLFEEGSRLIFNLFFVSLLLQQDTAKNASLCVISMAIGEVFQIIFLLLFADKKYEKRYKKFFNKEKVEWLDTGKEMMKMALPMTLSKIVGSLTYCLEPMIVMTLLSTSSDKDTITFQYGILSSYVMPMLLLPGFFSLALSNYLLPHLANAYEKKEYQKSKKLLKNILLICSAIGIFFSLTFFFFGGDFLNLLYHTQEGAKEIRLLAIPFFIYYLETPLTTAMNAMKMPSKAFRATVISSILRIVLLFLLMRKFHVFAVALATFVSCFFNVLLNSIDIVKAFHRQKSELSVH